MAAYLIVKARISDRSKFNEYAQSVTKLVNQFGGKYLAVSGNPEVLEGSDIGESVVIHEWSNRERAREFWYSNEYQQVKKLRKDTGQFSVVLVDGLPTEKGS